MLCERTQENDIHRCHEVQLNHGYPETRGKYAALHIVAPETVQHDQIRLAPLIQSPGDVTFNSQRIIGQLSNHDGSSRARLTRARGQLSCVVMLMVKTLFTGQTLLTGPVTGRLQNHPTFAPANRRIPRPAPCHYD
eukprot:768520-Hanusia_phi.AAC.8